MPKIKSTLIDTIADRKAKFECLIDHMKVIRNLGILIWVLTCFTFPRPVSAQVRGEVLLSNHTFSAAEKHIGSFQGAGQGTSLRLKGADGRLFRIADGQLYLRARALKLNRSFFDISIEEKYEGTMNRTDFRIVRDDFLDNGVIAHRGAFKNTGAAENSLLALKHAIEMGCAGSEFDVHMTLDSVLVVNHDPSIQGKVIANSTFAELAPLRLSSGESLPTLELFLRQGMLQNKTKLVLEIKPTTSKERVEALTRKVVGMVKNLKAQAWIDYISFDYNSCLEIKRLDPFARIAYLNGDKSPEQLKTDGLWGLDYHYSVFQKNPGWIGQAKEKGLTINTWTVNDKEQMNWFLNQKVDFITTNEPEVLLQLVKK